jgi:tight adherence protein B
VSAPLLAALAAPLGVWGTWEGLIVLEQAAPARAVGRALAPLQLAGRAGREPTRPERRRLAVLGSATLLAAGWLLAGPAAGLLLAAGGPLLVGRALAMHRRRWRRALAEGVPAVARALADALSGGHSVRGGLAELARAGAVPGPAGAELRSVARRLALGEPTEEVLEHLRRRAADPAWDTLVAAVLLQRRAGGDLARLLRSIAASCEHARRVEADARGLTAQARATAKLLGGLPVVAFALSALVAPGAVGGMLEDPRSRMLMFLALGVGAAGFAVIRRLARVGEA